MSNVRSEPLNESKAPPKSAQRTAMIQRQHAAWLLKWIVRLSAIVVLYGSWLGTAMLLAGAVPAPWWDIRALPASAIWWGLAIQAPITLAEFAQRHKRNGWGYRAPLIVDVGSTFLGYRPIIVPWLLTALHSGSAPGQASDIMYVIAANGASLFLAWFVAQFHELVLVGD